MMFRTLGLIFTLISTVSSAAYGVGAGVCPVFDDGTVLLGKERRHHGHVWSDFGGGQDPNETISQAAFREFKEETAHYTFPAVTLADVQNAPYADHIHHLTGQHYRMYFLWIHGPKPLVQNIHQNAALAHQNLGHQAHVEKTDWKYFNAQTIMNAHNQNGNLPGENEPLYGPMKAVVRQPAAQQFFVTYINAVANQPPLHPIVPPAAPPVAQPVPPVVVPPVVQQQKMRQATTKLTVRGRQTRHTTKRSTIRVRQTRQFTKRSTIRVKHIRQTYKHRRLSHSRRRR